MRNTIPGEDVTPEFSPEQIAQLRNASGQAIWRGLVLTILMIERNQPGTLLMLEARLRSDMPISKILAMFADANTSEKFNITRDSNLCEVLARGLNFRRQQLRQAANAGNN